eukprot:gene37670-49333_t
MSDVLGSMGDCLARSTGAIKRFDAFEGMPDRGSVNKIGIRPHREVFYRNTIIRETAAPPEVIPRRCTCKYVCTGAPAIYQCLSCSVYDPHGIGYYCNLCFTSRHPWYRAPHVFLSLDKDESIQHALQVQNANLEVDRQEVEGNRILMKLQTNYKRLEYIAEDVKIESDIKRVGRKAMVLEDRMIEMRRKLRADLRKNGPLPLNEDEGAIVVQK